MRASSMRQWLERSIFVLAAVSLLPLTGSSYIWSTRRSDQTDWQVMLPVVMHSALGPPFGLTPRLDLPAVLLSVPPPVYPDWPTYGYTIQRTGFNSAETLLGVSNAPGLHLLWSFNFGAKVDASPVLASQVMINGTPTDVIYTGSEHGDFDALNATTGGMIWQRNLGSAQTTCSDTGDGIFGVTSAPVLDRITNRIYAAGGDGRLYAMDLATGTDVGGWPVAFTDSPATEHVYGGLNLWNGALYLAIASPCDISPYKGRIDEFNTATAALSNTWYTQGSDGPDGGGIWGWGGVSISPEDGSVYAATGNSLASPENYPYAESVVRLSLSLQLQAANYPGVTGADVDFGSTPVLYQAPGCPPQLVVENKNGVLFVYNRSSIAGGPTQALQIANQSGAFIGVPAYSPATNSVYISNSDDSDSGTYLHGMVALQVQSDCTLRLAWQQTVGVNHNFVGPPTVANGVVYYGDGIGDQVFAFDAGTGQQLWNSGSTIRGPVFAAPIVANGVLYVDSWDNNFYAFGP